MSFVGLEVTFGGVALGLDPRGGVVRSAERTAFVADLHLGKTTLFRRRGLAVPEGDEARDLARLDALIADHGARRLVILGDLVHGAGGLTPDVVERFAAWRATRPALEVVLVRGNHDRGAGAAPSEWHLEVADGPVQVAGVECRHEPPRRAGDALGDAPRRSAPVLAGHLHPVVRLREGGRGAGLRPRCFWWRAPVLVLPAFGAFTGGHRVRAGAGDRVFAVPPESEAHAGIVELPA